MPRAAYCACAPPPLRPRLRTAAQQPAPPQPPYTPHTHQPPGPQPSEPSPTSVFRHTPPLIIIRGILAAKGIDFLRRKSGDGKGTPLATAGPAHPRASAAGTVRRRRAVRARGGGSAVRAHAHCAVEEVRRPAHAPQPPEERRLRRRVDHCPVSYLSYLCVFSADCWLLRLKRAPVAP